MLLQDRMLSCESQKFAGTTTVNNNLCEYLFKWNESFFRLSC